MMMRTLLLIKPWRDPGTAPPDPFSWPLKGAEGEECLSDASLILCRVPLDQPSRLLVPSWPPIVVVQGPINQSTHDDIDRAKTRGSAEGYFDPRRTFRAKVAPPVNQPPRETIGVNEGSLKPPGKD
jgi:hypothetical protein